MLVADGPLLRQAHYDCDEHCDDKVAKGRRFDHHASVPTGTAALRRLPLAALALTLGLAGVPMLSGSAHADALSDARAKAAEISNQLAALDQKQMDLESRVEIAEQRLAQANVAITAAQRSVDQANAALTQKQSDLTDFAVESYVSGNDPQSFETGMMDPGPDSSVKTGYLTTLSGTSTDLIDQVKASREKAEQQQTSLRHARDAAQAQVDAANSAKRSSAAAIAQEHAIQQQVNGQVATLVAADQQRRALAAQQAAQLAAQQVAARRSASTAPVTLSAHGSSGGSGGSGGSHPVVGPPPPVVNAPPPSSRAGVAVRAALSRIGDPYVWGAAGPNTFDCSGLVMWAWAQAGVSLPHFTGSQMAATEPIPISQLQPGDLVFVWGPGEGGGPPGHVGMYIGGGQMVHAPHTGATVTTVSIYWWPGATIAAGRVV
jgi:peptidoglycan DL-endopeptidase CwlO